MLVWTINSIMTIQMVASLSILFKEIIIIIIKRRSTKVVPYNSVHIDTTLDTKHGNMSKD